VKVRESEHMEERIGEQLDRTIAKEARSDALKLTKFHLEGFRQQQQYVKNLEEDIADRYETATKMCATYGEQIGHSSAIRLESGARLAGDEEHQQQKADYTKAKHLSERLERAIEDLPNAERVILQERYINSEKSAWDHIAERLCYDVSSCYRLHNQGLRSVAIHLFGIPDVLRAEDLKAEERKRKVRVL
jgi:DNA-directed RNA polymerase specialized sigma subunit